MLRWKFWKFWSLNILTTSSLRSRQFLNSRKTWLITSEIITIWELLLLKDSKNSAARERSLSDARWLKTWFRLRLVCSQLSIFFYFSLIVWTLKTNRARAGRHWKSEERGGGGGAGEAVEGGGRGGEGLEASHASISLAVYQQSRLRSTMIQARFGNLTVPNRHKETCDNLCLVAAAQVILHHYRF